jgi:hypothetical protein
MSYHNHFDSKFYVLVVENKYFLNSELYREKPFDEVFSNKCFLTTERDVIFAISIYNSLKENLNVSLYSYTYDSESITKSRRLLLDFEVTHLLNSLVSSYVPDSFSSPVIKEINLDSLQSTEIYRMLCDVHTSPEGNLLQNGINEKTTNAQISFFNYALNIVKSENVEGCLLETGTNKGFFGYIASTILGKRTLHTVDVNMESSKIVPILAKMGMNVVFNHGDSTQILNDYKIDEPLAFAWIDGGHKYEEALADLRNAARLGAKYIAIDDVKFFKGQVNVAYIDFLTEHQEYLNIDNPYWENDDVGIAWCKLTY